MGNNPAPPPPPPPQIVVIRTEPNPIDPMFLRMMIQQLVHEAINKHLGLQREGTNGSSKTNNMEIAAPQMRGQGSTTLAMRNSEAMQMQDRIPDVGIPLELRDRLLDREELTRYLEMDIPPEAMPAIVAALTGTGLRG